MKMYKERERDGSLTLTETRAETRGREGAVREKEGEGERGKEIRQMLCYLIIFDFLSFVYFLVSTLTIK